MAGDAPKVTVSVEAEVAKLEAAMGEAQKIVAAGAANMQQKMKENDPFKAFRQSRGDVFFAVQNISAGIQLAGAAMKVLSASGEQAVQAIEQLPLGLGQFAQGIHSIVDEWTGFREETEKIDELLKHQNDLLNTRSKEQDLKQKVSGMRAENAIDSESDPFVQLEKMRTEALRKADEFEVNNLQELGKYAAEIAEEQYRKDIININKKQEEVLKKQEEAANAAAKKEEEADKWLTENRIRNEKTARQYRVRENIEAAKREQDAISEQISAAQSELGGIAGPSAFMSSVSSAYGSFRTGQADAATAAMNRQTELQQRLVDLATEQKNLQAEIKFGLSVIGGPN